MIVTIFPQFRLQPDLPAAWRNLACCLVACLAASSGWWGAQSTAVAAAAGATPTVLTAVQDDEPASGLSDEELEKLRFRRMAPCADRNIFSPLDLPTPNLIRTASGRPGPEYWQQQADYQIDVTLDAEQERIQGRAQVTYTNNSPEELGYLWLALEQNLFRPDSDGSRFTPPGSRFNNRPGFVGGLTIDYVRTGDGKELKLHAYDTVGRLDLPEPVAARGGVCKFEIAWSFPIPDYGADRMGIRRCRKGKVFQLAQWFPFVCKFDDVHGWNTAPYLGQGEFYTEFGSYDVRITAPRNYIVVATGVLKNAKEVLTPKQLQQLDLAASSRQTVIIRGLDEIGSPESVLPGEGPLTWHFRADKVRTFAWAASDCSAWDAAAIIWPDQTTTLVQSLYPEEARVAWVESTQMLRHSILHYSDKWFRYPYPTAINVNGVCGGMEYPMIIFCGEDRNKEGLFAVTSHEIGHNWFPMVVNTNERLYAWMDEGFNTFINTYDTFENYVAVMNGEQPNLAPPPFTARTLGRLMSRPSGQPINLPADQIRPELLGVLAYFKTGIAMQMLREVVLGEERFDAAFRDYIRTWAFKSPQPADFFRCMENGAGVDLDWFWRGWFIENIPLDQAVVGVTQSERTGRARIRLANLGEMVMPVDLFIEYTDGSTTEFRLPVYVWYYTNLWTTEVDTQGKTIQRVTIDPRRVLPDLSRRNNSWVRPKETAEAGDSSTSQQGESEKSDNKPSGNSGDGQDDG